MSSIRPLPTGSINNISLFKTFVNSIFYYTVQYFEHTVFNFTGVLFLPFKVIITDTYLLVNYLFNIFAQYFEHFLFILFYVHLKYPFFE